ncbi:MAG: hypothetical protein ACKOPM_13705 [Novosphingobium sp.]
MDWTVGIWKMRSALPLAAGLAGVLFTMGLSAQSQTDAREAGKAGKAAPAKVAPAAVPPRIETRPSPPPAVEVLSRPVTPVARPKSNLKIQLSADGQTIYLVGMILDDSFHRFDEVLRGAPKARRVHLSSSGGYTIEARLIAALVRKHKLDTYVEYYCASACTQIFASGHDRVLGPLGKLGFHQAISIDPASSVKNLRPVTDRKLTSTTVFGVNGNDTLRLAYELAGVDPAFIDKALSYGHENMWQPGTEEMIAARIVTRRAETQELPVPPGGNGSRDEIRTGLLQSPLWRAALVRIPKTAEKTIDDVWRTANSGYSLAQASESGRAKLVMTSTHAMARAPDPLLERALALYAGLARAQRELGYPACRTESGELIESSEPDDLAFMRSEDALMVDFLMSEARVPALDKSEATRIFSREVLPNMTWAYRAGLATGKQSDCKIGFITFETIDALPKKKRLTAYRALLSMPGWPDAE